MLFNVLRYKRSAPILLFSLLLLFAWFLQSHLLLNSDVSWLVLASNRLKSGGSYLGDFFEINPPLILYLYLPITFIPFAITLALKIYIFVIGLFCWLLCYRLSREEFKNKATLSFINNLVLFFIFFIFPLNEFGQREHLLVLLTTPYFLLKTLQLKNQTPASKLFQLTIGVLAGLGFAIKPYFLLGFLSVESWVFYKKKRFYSSLETIGVLFILVLHAALVFSIHSDYLQYVIPKVAQFYYKHYGTNFWHLVLNERAFFVYFSLICFGICYRNSAIKEYLSVLVVASLSFFIVFLMQRTFWYYHFFPAMAYTFLLSGLIFAETVQMNSFDKRKFICIFFLMFVMFIYDIEKASYLSLLLTLYPITYFLLFISILSFVIYCNNQTRFISLIALTLITAMQFTIYLLFRHSAYHIQLFYVITVFFILGFIFIDKKLLNLVHVLLGLLLFAYPFYLVGSTYSYAKDYKKLYDSFLTALKPYHHKTIYYFTDSAEFAFPSVYYLNQKYSCRYGCFMWSSLAKENETEMNFYIDNAIEDFLKFKPDIILIDKRHSSSKLGYFGSTQIDYLAYFQKRPFFKGIWSQYRFVQTLDGQPLYRFDVYQRI